MQHQNNQEVSPLAESIHKMSYMVDMTDTPEAVRLPEPFGYLCDWGNDAYGLPRQIVYYGEPGSATEDDWNELPNVHRNTPIYTAEQVSALLRRIPELVAELQTALGQVRYLMKDQEAKAAERDQLRAELEKVRVPVGWVPVPVEPTWDMKTVAMVLADREWCYHVGRDDAKKLWSAMLSAAPTPPHADQKGQ